jgi:hypothetical protein
MESYEQAVDLALMVVNLDKSIYKTMLNTGLKQYLNSLYHQILQNNNEHEKNKFVLASKILLNDLQAIPVNNCDGRICSSCAMNNCDKKINYKTPVFNQALLNSENISNSQVTNYLDKFNPDTFDPNFSRLVQPLDTIGLYQNNINEILSFDKISGYGPEIKVRKENFANLNSHPISDTKLTSYSQYSSFYLNNNGDGFFNEEMTKQINDETPITHKNNYHFHKGKFI